MFVCPVFSDKRMPTGSHLAPWPSDVPMAMFPIAQVVTSPPFTSDLNALSPIGDGQEVRSENGAL